MGIAKTLQRYLEMNDVEYEILPHSPTITASHTAEASHISGEKIVKGVLIKDEDTYALAVLPASHHIQLSEISKQWGSPVGLATENEIGEIFADCDYGAIPPIGVAYNLNMIADETLFDLEEVYFEGGDHTTLVRVSGDDFRKLTTGARRARFARHD